VFLTHLNIPYTELKCKMSDCHRIHWIEVGYFRFWQIKGDFMFLEQCLWNLPSCGM